MASKVVDMGPNSTIEKQNFYCCKVNKEERNKKAHFFIDNKKILLHFSLPFQRVDSF